MDYTNENNHGNARLDYIISCMQQMSSLNPLAQSIFAREIMAGLKRILRKPTVNKGPVTADMLAVLAKSLGQFPSLAEVRLAVSCFIGSEAHLHFNDLAN